MDMLGAIVLFLNMGSSELILIMFVALLLFGGEKLPGLARGLGKGIRDFKDASEGVKREITNQINNFEEKKEAKAEVKPAELPAHEETKEAESSPLLDTTPIPGTTPINSHNVVLSNEGVPMHYDANGNWVEAVEHVEETPASGINLSKHE